MSRNTPFPATELARMVDALLEHHDDWPGPIAIALSKIAQCIESAPSGRITRSQLLDAVFAKVSRETANNRLSDLRKRLAASDADALGFALRLESSAHKDGDTQTYWFSCEGGLPSVASDMTLRAAAAARPSASVATTAISDTLEIMVSYSSKDGVGWGKLKQLLEDRLPARNDPRARRIRFWTFHELHGGDDDSRKIQEAIDRSALGLLLVSPNACASGYIQQQEWPRFRSEAGKTIKPFVAVLFEKVDDKKHSLGVLQRKDGNMPQLMHLRQPKQSSGQEVIYSWQDCSAKRCTAFVEKLIDDLLAKLPELHPEPPTTPPENHGQLYALANRKVASAQEHAATQGKQIHSVGNDSAANVSSRKSLRLELTETQPADHVAQDEDMRANLRPIQDQLWEWATDHGDNAPPFGVIFGEFGVGKTWNSQLFTQRLIAERQQSHVSKTGELPPLPIYFDLYSALGGHSPLMRSDSVPKLETILDTLVEQCTGPGESRQKASDIVAQVREQGALIVFDGLDELLTHKPDDWGVKFIHTLLDILPSTHWPCGIQSNATHPGHGKVLLTCRTHYFKSLMAQQQALSVQGRSGHYGPETRSWELQLFDEPLMRDYITRNAPDLNPQDTLAELRRIHDLYDLARRPIGLKYLLELLRGNTFAGMSDSNINAVGIYDRMVESWLQRDHGKHRLLVEDKPVLLQDLALLLWQRGERHIAWDDLQHWFRRWLLADPVRAHAYPPIAGQTPADNLNVLLEDLRTASLLTRPGDAEFAFAHTAMLEYFLARRLYRALQDSELDVEWPAQLSPETLIFIDQCQINASARERQQASRNLEALLNTPGDRPGKRTALALYTRAPHTWPQVQHINLDGMNLGAFQLHNAKLMQLSAQAADLRLSDWRNNQIDQLNLAGATLCGSTLLQLSGQQLDARDVDARFSHWHGIEFTRSVRDGGDWVDAEMGRCPAAWQPTPKLPMQVHPQWLAERRGGRMLASIVYQDELLCLSTHTDYLGEDRAIRLWNAQGCCLATFPENDERTTFAALAEHQGLLFCLTSGISTRTVKLWDGFGKLLHVMEPHTESVAGVAMVSHLGELFCLSGSADHTAQLWRVHEPNRPVTLRHETKVTSVALLSHQGELYCLTGAMDGVARLWNSQGSVLSTLTGHQRGVFCVALAYHQTRLICLTGGGDCTARLWDATGQELVVLNHDKSEVQSVALATHQGELFCLTDSEDGVARLYNVHGECLARMQHEIWLIKSTLAIYRDVLYCLCCSSICTANVWGSTGLVTQLGYHVPTTAFALICEEDKFSWLSADLNGDVKLLNYQDGNLSVRVQKTAASCIAWAIHQGELCFATGAYHGEVQLWNTKGQCFATLNGLSGAVKSIDLISYRGELFCLASGNSGQVILWNEQGQCLNNLKMSLLESSDIALYVHQDSLFYVTGSSFSQACLRNIQGKLMAILPTTFGRLPRVALGSHQANLIAATSSHDGSAFLWDAQGTCLATLKGHTECVTAIALQACQDASFCLTGSTDQTARLWDAKGECLATFTGHKGRVIAVELVVHHDVVHCLTGTENGALYLWRYTPANGEGELLHWTMQQADLALDFSRPDWGGPAVIDALWPYVHWVDAETNPPRALSFHLIEQADAATRARLRDGFGRVISG